MLAAGVLAIGVAFVRARPAPGPPMLPEASRPIIFAHRGGAAEGPESTLPTMLEVIARNPQVAIELDVRRSRDGEIVVNHDATVDRTTNGTGRVADLTWAELRGLDAGYCATPGQGAGTARPADCRDPAQQARFVRRGQGYHLATLDEVFAGLPPTTAIGIEVKEPGFEADLAARVRRSGRLSRIVLGSGHDDVASRLRALLPDVPHYFPAWAGARAAVGIKLGGGHFSRPDHQVMAFPRRAPGLALDTPGFVAGAHRLGISIVYFIIDGDDEMERLLRLGADGLITNYPSRARAVSDRLVAAAATTPAPAAR